MKRRFGGAWALIFGGLMATLSPALAAKSFEIGKIHTSTLGNGLECQVLEMNKLPLVAVSALVYAGTTAEPADKAGLANLTASLLDAGTKTRSAEEFARTIDATGGSLDVSSDRDGITISAKVMARDLDLALDLMADMLRNPAFAGAEVERLKGEIAGGIQESQSAPKNVGSDAFLESLFTPQSPYGRRVDGTVESVSSLTAEDCRKFYEVHYGPKTTAIVVVGDVKPSAVKKAIKKHFGDWKNPHASSPAKVAPPVVKGLQHQIVNRDISQAYFFIGHKGVPRSSRDYVALRTMNYILGGGSFSSRMMLNIRSTRGLAYSVYSYFLPFRDTGVFEVELQTKVGSAQEAMEQVFAEIRRVQTEGVTAQELEDAQGFYAGSLARVQETASQLSSLIQSAILNNLPEKYWIKDREVLDALTPADLQRVAKEYLDPENLQIVVVADEDKLNLDFSKLKK